MGIEGSIGTPSFKQIIMQKQRQKVQEGVKISGYDSFKQSGGKNKGKKQVEDNESRSNTQIKGNGNEGLEKNEDKNTTGQ